MVRGFQDGHIIGYGWLLRNPKVPQLSFERFRRNKERLSGGLEDRSPNSCHVLEARWKPTYQTHETLRQGSGAGGSWCWIFAFLAFPPVAYLQWKFLWNLGFWVGQNWSTSLQMFPGTWATKCSSLWHQVQAEHWMIGWSHHTEYLTHIKKLL